MGCDIHVYVEKKTNGKWDRVLKKFDLGRNYKLFSIFANVRNGYGFAGSDTGDALEYIAEPKGLPKDLTKEVEKEYLELGSDAHTPSWLTLKEILDFDWTKKAVIRGVVKAFHIYSWTEYHKNKGIPPDEWCSAVFGGSSRVVEEKEMRDLLEKINPPLRSVRYNEVEKIIEEHLPSTYAKVSWEQTYSSCCDNFWVKAIPQLLKNADDYNDIRLVFWFDN
jgi:hypothetical protein